MARSPIFNFRLDDDAKARWQAAADEAGEGLSEFIRDAVEDRIANPSSSGDAPVVEVVEIGGRRGGKTARLEAAAAAHAKAFKGPDPKPASTKRERR